MTTQAEEDALDRFFSVIRKGVDFVKSLDDEMMKVAGRVTTDPESEQSESAATPQAKSGYEMQRDLLRKIVKAGALVTDRGAPSYRAYRMRADFVALTEQEYEMMGALQKGPS